MQKIRDIIRLHENGLSYREIGRALRVSHPLVSQFSYHFQVWRDADQALNHTAGWQPSIRTSVTKQPLRE